MIFPNTKPFALGTTQSCIAQTPNGGTTAPCLMLMCLSGPGLVISGTDALLALKEAIDFALQTKEE